MIEITCGFLMAVSIYLILEKANYRKIFGITLFSTTINLILLVAGRHSNKSPAFIGAPPEVFLSNPVPQALILTAIVIGFGLLIYLSVIYKAIKK